MVSYEIRVATPDDFLELGELMFDAVRNGDSEYSEEQRAAWVPAPRKGVEWVDRLASQKIFVAESKHEDSIVGFMSLAVDRGYLDFAYIRPWAQGQGIFRALYEEIEKTAKAIGSNQIWVHASLKAKPAFLAVGFHVTQSEQVLIGNVSLDRFEMKKSLVE